MLANNRIERTITFSQDSGLATTRLRNLDTNTELIPQGEPRQRYAPEFALQCNDITLEGSGPSFQLVSGQLEDEPDGKQLTITLHAKHSPLLVEVVYRVYTGQPATRKWLVLHNTGKEPLRLSHLKVESLALSVGPSNETLLNALYGTTPREMLYTGRSEDVGLLITNGMTGDGFAILNEVPGYMKRTEVDGYYHPGHAFVTAMYDTDLMPFERTLLAGEAWQTAGVSLVAFREGSKVSDPQWVLPTYGSAVLERKIGRAGSPWIYNTWAPFKRTINQAIARELIDVAGPMGMDIFTIDDGWEKEYGENTVDPIAFPDGLAPIRSAVESKGMRLGLWMPLATIDKDTQIYKQHPEWVATDQDGKPKETSTAAGSEIVMCMASPYRDVAAARINDAIDQFHLAYVKLDLTTVFNAYGESPGCWPTAQRKQSWSESLGGIYESIQYVTKKIYARHPDVLIDLSFELWGQKHLIDAGLLTYGDMDWLSNVDDTQPNSAGPRQARTLLYQRARSIPADTMLIGNMLAEVPDIGEVFATEIGSAPLLLGDLRKLSSSQRLWYRDHIAWFKQLRSEADLGDSFFALGSWQQPTPAAWDGFARVSRSGVGVVVVFRNESGLSSAHVTLPLLPEGTYTVRSAMTHKDLAKVASTEWAEGVDVKFPEGEKVEILEIREIKKTGR
jgi:alpha-galactosidase